MTAPDFDAADRVAEMTRQPTEMELRVMNEISRVRINAELSKCRVGDVVHGATIEKARAAIRAMREPTKDMTDDGVASFTREYCPSDEDIAETWRAMIDAASPTTGE